MNAAHWHLAINHFPVISIIIATLVLLFNYFFFKKNNAVRNTALGILVFSALVAIPAYFTGEEAEEIVEHLPGIGGNTIERHEDFGKWFFIAVELLGLLAAASLIAGKVKSKSSSIFRFITIVLALGVSVFGLQVANSGGKIRHSEINGNIEPAGQLMSYHSQEQDID